MKGAGDHDCDRSGCLANVPFPSPSSVLRPNWTPSWRRRHYPATFSTRRLRKSQFRGRTPNAMVQKKAPGRNPSRSGLSAGGEVRIPITSAVQAQDRIDPIASGVQCRRLRASKPSRPSPTNHQAGRQKNGIVMVCHARADNAAGCWRRNEAAGTERGGKTGQPEPRNFVCIGGPVVFRLVPKSRLAFSGDSCLDPPAVVHEAGWRPGHTLHPAPNRSRPATRRRRNR